MHLNNPSVTSTWKEGSIWFSREWEGLKPTYQTLDSQIFWSLAVQPLLTTRGKKVNNADLAFSKNHPLSWGRRIIQKWFSTIQWAMWRQESQIYADVIHAWPTQYRWINMFSYFLVHLMIAKNYSAVHCTLYFMHYIDLEENDVIWLSNFS